MSTSAGPTIVMCRSTAFGNMPGNSSFILARISGFMPKRRAERPRHRLRWISLRIVTPAADGPG